MDDNENWILVTGESDGKPVYIRARDPGEIRVNAGRNFLVVASLGYPVRGGDQLPSDEDYDRISDFEEGLFDTPESDPELVFVETGSGLVRYFAYTSDANRTLAAIKEKSAPFEILDLDSVEDSEWQIYFRRVERLDGG